jgi:hypothetical protein
VTSSDGISWTTSTTNIPFNEGYSEVAWGNNRFVTVNIVQNDTIFTSTDGLTWTSSGQYGAFQAKIIWADNQFVVEGLGGSLLTSPDGLTWTIRGTIGIEENTNALAWGNEKFVITTSTANYTSLDGITWNLEDAFPGEAELPYMLAYGNGKFVAVSLFGAVYTSSW